MFAPKDAKLSGSGVTKKSLLDALATRKALRSRLTLVSCGVKGVELDTEDDGASNHSYEY